MQYNRTNISNLSGNQFEVGVHIAEITAVGSDKKSKSGNDMFAITVEGERGESATNYLTFGLKWSDGNLNRILASIEDNRQKIAPIDYGFNREIKNFLVSKRVFIQIKERSGSYTDKNTGEVKQSTGTEIKAFLRGDEYASLGGGKNQATTDPFAGSKSTDISDDDLPF